MTNMENKMNADFNHALSNKWRETPTDHPIKEVMTVWRMLKVAAEIVSPTAKVGQHDYNQHEYKLVGDFLKE